MDRIEASELIELEQAEGMAFKTLKLPQVERFRPKKGKWTPSNKEQALADDIYQFFDKKLSFRRILINFIRDKGYEATYKNFKACQSGKTPIALFQWMMKNEVVIWKTTLS